MSDIENQEAGEVAGGDDREELLRRIASLEEENAALAETVKRETRSVSILVLLTPTNAELLKSLAAESGVSRNEMVNRLIEGAAGIPAPGGEGAGEHGHGACLRRGMSGKGRGVGSKKMGCGKGNGGHGGGCGGHE
ncbi:MAG: hypothetical protein K6A65_04905, partial [Succinivibrionaceae bacterium]|nr:hypothetical protein [Succinivibrionaceae bacterium]